MPPCRLWSSTSTRYPEALVRQLAGAFLRLEAAPRAGEGRDELMARAIGRIVRERERRRKNTPAR